MPSISEDVRAVLSQAVTEGSSLKLVGKLDRPLYTATNKVLEAAGGKWNRKAQSHIFDGAAADVIEPILLTGEYRLTKQEFGQFDTPRALADRLVRMAEVEPGMRVLEPNAGLGNIVDAVIAATGSGAAIFGYEVDPKRHAACVTRHFRAFGAGGLGLGDFLAVEPNPVFDRVVMNPPFARQADIDHVLHAYKFLKPNGILVAIMSAGVLFRQDKKATAFRQFLDTNGEFYRLDPGSFKESGTMVEACIVKLYAWDR